MTGYGVTRLAVNRLPGAGPASAGASLNLPTLSGSVMALPGRSGYDDVAPWYSHVEKFIGICGNKDGLEAMPDGEFLPPFEMNCVQEAISKKINEHYPDRHMVHARWAHLTKPEPIHLEQGRVQCQARNLCMRGCPFGGYFSSNHSTLPWAKRRAI